MFIGGNKIDFIRCRPNGTEAPKEGSSAFLGRGMTHQGFFVYWGKKLSLSFFLQNRLEKSVNAVINFSLLALGVWGVFIFFGEIHKISQIVGLQTQDLFFWKKQTSGLFVFWLSLLGNCFLYYRLALKKDFSQNIPEENYSREKKLQLFTCEDLKHLKKSQKIDIAQLLDNDAWSALEKGWILSRNYGHPFLPVHVLAALLKSPDTKLILLRLGVDISKLDKMVFRFLKKLPRKKDSVDSIENTIDTFFSAYLIGFEYQKKRIGAGELLAGLTSTENNASDILFELGVTHSKLKNVVFWFLLDKRLKEQSRRFQRLSRFKPSSGLDRAMTAVATPFLDSVSEDLTGLARAGFLERCIGRNRELESVFRVLESGTQNVLLVAPQGVGTTTLVGGIAQKMVEESVPSLLRDKRLVSLSIPALASGTSSLGDMGKRLEQIALEVSAAGNIVLFIDHLHDMVGLGGGKKDSLDVSDQLVQFLSKKSFLSIATSTPEAYTNVIEKSRLPSVFTKVNLDEMSKNQTVMVLEAKAGLLERKHGIFFSYDAIEKTVELSSRYLHEEHFPQKAVKLFEEVAVYVERRNRKSKIVIAEDVAAVLSSKIDMPLTQISVSESEKLLNLEKEIHKRVIGQEEAVIAVSEALRRSRAELRDINRPIANFLFMGPTGVGKTELAKTVAQVYFGREDDIVRIDMSEYQEKSSINRLIGSPGDSSGGLLTEGIRRNPFTLLLLDELEKAHPDILNLFLQVMDEGHLTDSVGRKIDFTNAIIIATSNAGTSYIQNALKNGQTVDQIKTALVHEELKDIFRPEFLNRFDSIVVFRPLELSEIEKIAKLMLKKVQKRLLVKGIKLKVTEDALSELSEKGFDPLFGARPLRRAIQDNVDNALAKFLLKGKIGRRDTVVLEKGGKINVEKAINY